MASNRINQGTHMSTSSTNAEPPAGKQAGTQASQNAPGRLTSEQSDGRSLREKFNVDSRTGGVSFRLVIPTSPGRGGFGPSLELIYDSGSANSNGVFGAGWKLGGVQSIRRKTSLMIPVYDDERDTFVHSTAGDLVPVIRHGNEAVEWDDVWDGVRCRVRLYQPCVESHPLRVERWESLDGSGIKLWKTIESGNVATVFGQDTDSRIARRSRGQEREMIFAWLATEVRDGFGNQMTFNYKGEPPDTLAAAVGAKVYEANREPLDRATQRYLKSIRYGNKQPNRDMANWMPLHRPQGDADASQWAFEVVFDYGEHAGQSPTTRESSAGWELRHDPFSVCTSGFEIRTYRRCERVLMFHHFAELGRPEALVAATELNYEPNPKSGISFLKSCVQCGYQSNRAGDLSCIRLPPTQFEYWQAPDIDTAPVDKLELGLAGLTTADVQWVDLNGEGAPGVLAKVPGGGAWFYHSNNSDDTKPAVGGPSLLPYIPSLAASNDWSFEDLTGDGKLDFVFASPSSNVVGFHERLLGHKSWSDFVPMESYPTDCFLSDNTIKRLDLSGNGLADRLQLAAEPGDELPWYPALGRLGYGREKRTVGGPHVPIQDQHVAVVVCDMTGDGLSDIALIRNSHVCYWPNMGHGRFGPCVVMKNPPFLAAASDFNPLRVRVADMAGSGTSDLIYLPPHGGVHIYYNRSGNAWSDAHVRAAFPSLDNLCAVDALDIGGWGTQCLVWMSDHPGYHCGVTGSTMVRFIDVMGGCKPGLLTKCTNGIGGEVEISYRSSTHYYLDDQRAGKSWTTQLPFPMTCVERVVTRDLIAETSSTMRYAYHNGSYDSKERQFRGFQMVEEWDAQELSTSTNKFCQPPLHTKTWFYVGSQELDSAATLPEYFSTDVPQQRPLPAAEVVSALTPSDKITPEEVQGAYRALAGCPRRQEVFGEDRSSNSVIPYVVTDHKYEVVIHQKISPGQRYGRFRVNTQEELTLHYERDAREASVQHTVTIETDCFGNVCKQAVINYGKAGSNLSRNMDQKKQQETFVHLTETDYTNAIDPYTTPAPNPAEYFQAPLSSEIREYRVFPGFTWACPSTDRYTRDTLIASLPGTEEISFHSTSPIPAGSEIGLRKLISKARTVYSTGDLKEKLPLHELAPLSVEYQIYQLAFSRKLLESILKDDKNKPLLSSDGLENELMAGGFVCLDNDNEWWTQSPRKVFNGDPSSRTSSLVAARSLFYMPNAEIDPFGNVTYQEMDKYRLLPVKSVNALGSEVCFENNYVHLQPQLIIDANGNRTQVAFDPCGRTVGIAVMGKVTEAVGDSLDNFSVEVSPEDMDSLMEDPSGPVAARLLGHAGRRTIYLDHCRRSTVNGRALPSFHAELVRDTHYQDTAGPEQIAVSLTYFDGHGESIQQVSLSGNSDPVKKWQFSGWVIRDNKRQPVKEFNPFTAATHDFRTQVDSVSAPATTFLRDPLGRVVATLNADHTWTKTRLGTWSRVDFDEGDTVCTEDPATDQDVGVYFSAVDRRSYFPTWKNWQVGGTVPGQAIAKSEAYHDTPTTAHKDALGRDIVVEVDNGQTRNGRDIRTNRIEYNLSGHKVVSLRDALDRVVETTQYSLLEEPLRTENMDGGSRWFLPDCLGSPFLSWSSRGDRKRIVYDKLRRIEQVRLSVAPEGAPEIVIMKSTYGEGQTNARANNLAGELYRLHDQSGLHTNKRFDFHGNCVESSVQYAVEYKQTLDWSLNIELEDVEYDLRASFNTIGRAVHVQDFSGESVQRTYDVANRLTSLKSLARDSTTIASVHKMEYSEDGKVVLIEYGNGSCTAHEYDTKTRRLARTCTRRIRDGTILEDVAYTRDCLGRIVHKKSRAQQTIHFDNNAVTPSQEFRYDAVGQLVEATGREQIDASQGGQRQLRRHDTFSGRGDVALGNGREVVEYLETYEYDLAGNILQMQHAPRKADGYSGWTRTYAYREASCVDPRVISNRLSSTAIGETTQTYRYDGIAGQNGCTTSIPKYSMMAWDHDDRLRSFSTQRVTADGGATPEMTWYVYNAGGERVRKITERGTPRDSVSPPTKSKDTRFLPLRDIYMRFSGDPNRIVRTITTTHVGDSALASGPIALVEHDSSMGQRVIRYQVSQHLELDNNSQVVSYEEFSPYGCSTYQTRKMAAPRKYRFMRYQHDRESGLYLCGARYYMPWLGRWTSPDPLGIADGLNVYAYVSNDPVNFDDQQGTMKEKQQTAGEPSTSEAGGSGTRPPGAAGAQAPRGAKATAPSSGSSLNRSQGPKANKGEKKNYQGKGKSTEPVSTSKVQLTLESIRYSQKNIGGSLYDRETGQRTICIDSEVEALGKQMQLLVREQRMMPSDAAAVAARDFMGRLEPIRVVQGTKLIPQLEKLAGNNKEMEKFIESFKGMDKDGIWVSVDNRRFHVMKTALPPGTMIEANEIQDIDGHISKFNNPNGGRSVDVRPKRNEKASPETSSANRNPRGVRRR